MVGKVIKEGGIRNLSRLVLGERFVLVSVRNM